MPEIVAEFVLEILRRTKKGSILAFLPGEALIKEAVKLIQSRKREIDPANEIPVLGIFSRLGEEEVERLFSLKGKNRRVLITTDIAETSHTLEDIVYVIDSGYQKEKEWDPETATAKLKTKKHSQAGCKQRWGRVGRIQKGYVYCLYTKDQFENKFKKYTEPEIFRSSLNDTLLTLKAGGVSQKIPFIGKPQDREGEKRIEKEIKRALEEIKAEGQIDEKGIITEDALEIFHTPLSPDEVSFLKLADEMNCLLEAVLMLFLSSTDEKEPRTGSGLYDQYRGLLQWNENWKASTKEKVYRIHQGLKIGCQDDLDFIMKLAFLAKRNGEKWAKRHFVNQNILEIISKAEEFIDDKYRQKVREKEEKREINWRTLNKIRLILALNFPQRIIDIKKDNIINFWAVGGRKKKGIISKHCKGRWRNGEQAFCLLLGEEKNILNGKEQFIPCASFLVELREESKEVDQNHLFVDQIFPIGSMVSVKEESGKTYVEKLLEKPPPIKVRYNKPIDPWESKNIGKEEDIEFDHKWIINPENETMKIEGIWEGENKSKEARITGWIERNGKPAALLISPKDEEELREAREKSKNQLEVKIEKVIRYPTNRGGWVLGRTQNGLLFPIEMGEMGLDPLCPGLEMVEEETVTLTIKDFDEEGIPQLSNIDRIIRDLENIKKEISKKGRIAPESKRRYIDLSGYIADVDPEKEIVTVVIKRENGIVHPFEVAKKYLPEESVEPEKSVDSLRIGKEVVIRLLIRKDKDKVPLYYFTKEEIDSMPKNWKDAETGKISVPFCLKKIEGWSARPEAIDFVKRHSWRYFLNARITKIREIDKHAEDILKFLKAGDKVRGTVIGYKYRKDGKISGIKVKIKVDTPQGKRITYGFVPKSKLRNLVDFYRKGEKIDLIIIDVPGLVFMERS